MQTDKVRRRNSVKEGEQPRCRPGASLARCDQVPPAFISEAFTGLSLLGSACDSIERCQAPATLSGRTPSAGSQHPAKVLQLAPPLHLKLGNGGDRQCRSCIRSHRGSGAGHHGRGCYCLLRFSGQAQAAGGQPGLRSRRDAVSSSPRCLQGRRPPRCRARCAAVPPAQLPPRRHPATAAPSCPHPRPVFHLLPAAATSHSPRS